MQLNSNQIQQIIPHRYPFLLIDRVLDMEPGQWGKGIKCVTANEMQFMGHFPQEHVMPGVLIVESMAQLGAVVMLSLEETAAGLPILAALKMRALKIKYAPAMFWSWKCRL